MRGARARGVFGPSTFQPKNVKFNFRPPVLTPASTQLKPEAPRSSFIHADTLKIELALESVSKALIQKPHCPIPHSKRCFRHQCSFSILSGGMTSQFTSEAICSRQYSRRPISLDRKTALLPARSERNRLRRSRSVRANPSQRGTAFQTSEVGGRGTFAERNRVA